MKDVDEHFGGALSDVCLTCGFVPLEEVGSICGILLVVIMAIILGEFELRGLKVLDGGSELGEIG